MYYINERTNCDNCFLWPSGKAFHVPQSFIASIVTSVFLLYLPPQPKTHCISFYFYIFYYFPLRRFRHPFTSWPIQYLHTAQFLANLFAVTVHAYAFDEQNLIEMKPRPMKKRSGVIAGIGDAGVKETTLGNGDDKGEVSLDLLTPPHLIIVLRFLSVTSTLRPSFASTGCYAETVDMAAFNG